MSRELALTEELSQILTKHEAPNARHQRRVLTSASDKPCMRDMLIARPLHAAIAMQIRRGSNLPLIWEEVSC